MGHQILIGDCREQMRSLPEQSVHCCVSSPPYFGLRDYGVDGQIGLEPTPAEFVAAMVAVYAEVWRVLRDDGVCFINLGDSYASAGKNRSVEQSTKGTGLQGGLGTQCQSLRQPNKIVGGLKEKDLCGMPWRVAFALQDAGWYLRQDIIWAKPNPMPESVRDRCCKAHEYIFLLTKSPRYFWDGLAIATPSKTADNRRPYTSQGAKQMDGREVWHGGEPRDSDCSTSNRRSVWHISTQSFKGAHFATFPERIPELCIKAGTSERGCCPTCGKQWVRVVEKVRRPTRPGENTKVKVPSGWMTGSGSHGSFHEDGRSEPTYRETAEVGNRDPQRHVTETVTTGWRQDCQCEAHEPVPSVVLDPFLGSGTTVQVATHLGQHGLGCELNPEYVALAEQRIATPPRFLTRKASKKRQPKPPKPRPTLFT